MKHIKTRRIALLACSATLGLALQATAQSAYFDAEHFGAWPDRATGPRIRIVGGHGEIDQSRAIERTGIVLGRLGELDPTVLPPPEGLDDGLVEAVGLRPDWAFLDLAQAGDRLALPLPDARSMELVLVRREEFSDGSTVWIGQVAGIAASDVIIARNGSSLRVQVRDLNHGAREVQIFPGSDGVHRIAFVGPLGSEGLCGTGLMAEADAIGGGSDESLIPYGAAAGDDPSNLIDVMIVASNQALASYGSYSSFRADAQLMIADMNLRVANSGGSWTYRLCADGESFVSYDEVVGDLGANLTHLRVYGDGLLDEIQEYRNDFRPDLVHLIIESPEPAPGGGNVIGQAYLLDSLAGDINKSYGVTVRSYATSPNTFSHEIGHNMGLCHNLEESAVDCGVADYAHGIAKTCSAFGYEDTERRTTMSYKVCSCSSGVVPYFSVTGLSILIEGIFGEDLCTLDLWDSATARSIDAMNTSRTAIADYQIGSAQIWARSGSSGGNGTYLYPQGSLKAAADLAAGGAGVATVRARGGEYVESSGGPVVLSNPVTITKDNLGGYSGNVVIE